MIKNKALVFAHGRMERHIQVIGTLAWSMALEFILGLMVIDMKDSGLKKLFKDKVPWSMEMVLLKKDYGMKAS